MEVPRLQELKNAFDVTFVELIDELKKARIIPANCDYQIPTPEDFRQSAEELDLERHIVENDPKVLNRLHLQTAAGQTVLMKPIQKAPPEFFAYLRNLLLISTTVSCSASDFERVYKNLENVTQAQQPGGGGIMDVIGDGSGGLMDIIGDVHQEITNKISPDKLKELEGTMNESHAKDPFSIIQAFSASGVDVMGMIESLSTKVSQRVERGELNENDLMGVMSTLMQKSMTG